MDFRGRRVSWMKVEWSRGLVLGSMALGVLAMATVTSEAGTRHPASCRKVVLTGEAGEGQQWRAAFGQGWAFRVLPIQPGPAGYSGWDLVVDREQPAGYPDALLLATPPYNSINEREVGTTFGLRAQDAIGWNPRSFRFLTSAAAFRESQQLFRQLSHAGLLRPATPGAASGSASGSGDQNAVSRNASEARATRRLMELARQSSAGEFRILDARLAPGISDAAPYAESWALASPRTPHTLVPASPGRSTERGELRWMRFSITLWLPGGWIAPRELNAAPAACPE